MEMLKTDKQSTSSSTPKIFLLDDNNDNITEIEIEFFKSKPKRLTSLEVLNYLTHNFSKDKLIMLKTFNIKNLKNTKDIVLISLIISSLSNILVHSRRESNLENPTVFEITKITRIQSNNQFEQDSESQEDKEEPFGHVIDTGFDLNIDDCGNVWIRNIFIDEANKIISSNWHAYSIAGFFLGEFDKSGFNITDNAYRTDDQNSTNNKENWSGAIKALLPECVKHYLEYLSGNYREEIKFLKGEITELKSDITKLKSYYEEKLEKNETKLEKKEELWAKQMSAKEESWTKQMSEKETLWTKRMSEKETLWAKQISEKNLEIKELQFKIFDILSRDK